MNFLKWKFWYPFCRYWRYLKATFTKNPSRKKPKVGEIIECCNGKLKRVEFVSMREDTIDYDDGSSDSYFHCGWHRVIK